MTNLENRNLPLILRTQDYPELNLFAMNKIMEIKKEQGYFDGTDMLEMYLDGVFEALDFLNDLSRDGEICVTEHFPYDIIRPELYK